MDKRTILAVVLSLAVLFLYQTFLLNRNRLKNPRHRNRPSLHQKGQHDNQASTPEKATAPKNRDGYRICQTGHRLVTSWWIPPLYSCILHPAPPEILKLKDYYQDCYKCNDDLWPKIKRLFTGSKDPVKPKTKDFVELVDVQNGMPIRLP